MHILFSDLCDFPVDFDPAELLEVASGDLFEEFVVKAVEVENKHVQ